MVVACPPYTGFTYRLLPSPERMKLSRTDSVQKDSARRSQFTGRGCDPPDRSSAAVGELSPGGPPALRDFDDPRVGSPSSPCLTAEPVVINYPSRTGIPFGKAQVSIDDIPWGSIALTIPRTSR